MSIPLIIPRLIVFAFLLFVVGCSEQPGDKPPRRHSSGALADSLELAYTKNDSAAASRFFREWEQTSAYYSTDVQTDTLRALNNALTAAWQYTDTAYLMPIAPPGVVSSFPPRPTAAYSIAQTDLAFTIAPIGDNSATHTHSQKMQGFYPAKPYGNRRTLYLFPEYAQAFQIFLLRGQDSLGHSNGLWNSMNTEQLAEAEMRRRWLAPFVVIEPPTLWMSVRSKAAMFFVHASDIELDSSLTKARITMWQGSAAAGLALALGKSGWAVIENDAEYRIRCY